MISRIFDRGQPVTSEEYGIDIIHHDGDLVKLTAAMTFLKSKGYILEEKDLENQVYTYKSQNGIGSKVSIRNSLIRDAIMKYNSREGVNKSADVLKGLRRILEPID